MNFDLKLIILLICGIVKICRCDSWQDINIICPQQCVCQYAHYGDISVTKWIKTIETRHRNQKFNGKDDENLVNDNEVNFKDDSSFINNDLVKFAMCMLQSSIDAKNLISTLPHDVQALVLLYTDDGQNISVSLSDFNPLLDLTTLEIRGTPHAQFKLLFDEPLSQIKHLNLESIALETTESMKFRPNVESIDPSQNFHYVPNSDKFEYNMSIEIVHEDVEILPYEVYKMEIERLHTVSFFGWNHLEVLRINECNLKDLQWEMFDGLDKLEHLSLERNNIKSIPAFLFYGAMNLKSLSLANNFILDMSYRGLAGLLDLELLDLSFNNISKLSESTFPPFPKLQVLDIRSNPIKSLYRSTFGVMNSTKTLSIGSSLTPMDFNAQKPFLHLEKLSFLEIKNVSTPNLNQNSFEGLNSIEVLNLRGSIGIIEFDTFSEMKKLIELNMSYCNIREMSMDTFFGAKEIKIVDLSNNCIKFMPIGLFDDQDKIQEIYLNNNLLTRLPIDIFNIKSIKLLRLINNPWECNCLMTNWKQAITNKVRAKKVNNKCSSESHLYKKNCMSTTTQTYTFEHKIAPICNEPEIVKDRSVYYALRKILKCSRSTIGPQKTRFKQKFEMYIAQQNSNHEIKKTKDKKQKLIGNKNTLHYQMFHHKNVKIDAFTYNYTEIMNDDNNLLGNDL